MVQNLSALAKKTRENMNVSDPAYCAALEDSILAIYSFLSDHVSDITNDVSQYLASNPWVFKL